MDDKRSWGDTVLGWFVEPAAEAPAPGAPSADGTPPSAEAGTPTGDPVFASDPPAAINGRVDFDAVFAAAGIPEDARSRVTKAVELLGSLPPDTPAPVKKQIVEASLRAFGVPLDAIVQTAVSEIQALDGYVRAGAGDTQRVLADAEKRIGLYEGEIRQLRTIMEQRVVEQQAVVRACADQTRTVQQVLDFFGSDAVARAADGVRGTDAAPDA